MLLFVDDGNSPERVCAIAGSPDKVQIAAQMIQELLNDYNVWLFCNFKIFFLLTCIQDELYVNNVELFFEFSKEKVEWVVVLEVVEVAVVLVEVVVALEVVLVEEWAVGMDLEDFRMKLSLLSLLTSVDWLLEKVGGKNIC